MEQYGIKDLNEIIGGCSQMNRDVIIACDFNSKEELYTFLDRSQKEKPFLKIDVELSMRKVPKS